MARVFISHADADLALAGQVHGWLVDAGHEVFLDRDLRDGITLGEEWERRLHEELRRADAVVCVVTSAFLASRWCTAEVAITRSRGIRLLPLHAEPGVADPLLTSVQHSDLTTNPDLARTTLAEALRQVDTLIEAAQQADDSWPPDRSPFPGLRPFEADWHRVFFGRTQEVRQLTELLRSPAEHAEGAALLVVGPSGCGKSSLVRAGLLPVLTDEPGWRALPPILPGADPVTALARELAAAARRAGLDWTLEHVRHQLDQHGLTGLADELLLADLAGPQQRLLIVVDQFEELLTQTPPAQRIRFAELLRPALTSPVRVVATLRPEFLDPLLLDPDLAAFCTRPYVVRPLRREALRAVIEQPAQLAGIEVDDGLVDRLVDDTDTGEALPLLAFTLAQLAEGVTHGGRLSSTRYDQLGGVQGALTRQADAALTDAIAAGGRSRDQVIAGLLRLITVDEQGRPTRWRISRPELPDHVFTELNAFIARRLLTTDSDNGTAVIGVAHEAFLSAWPPLAQAITQNVSALRARRAVEHAATEWHDSARPPTRLWTGGQLAAAVTDTGAHLRTGKAPADPAPRHEPSRWLPQRRRALVTDRVDLSAKARDFLHASIRHDRYRSRRTITLLSVLLILALVAAGIAVGAQRSAVDRQRVATARHLIDEAEAARATDLRAALLLGLAAHRIHPDGETRSSLVNTLAAGPYLGTLTGHTGSVNSVAFAPDGRTLATSSADKTVILWDLTDRARPRQLGPPLTGHRNTVESLAFTPNGQTLATGSSDNTVILWDLTDRAQPHQLGSPLTGHSGPVNSVALTPDGRTLVTGSSDHTVVLWDLTDRAQPHQLGSPLTGHSGPVNSVALTPDGRTLATGSSDHTVVLWDLTDRAQPRQLGSPLIGNTGLVKSVTFAPDGHTLAAGSAETGTVSLWDVTDRAHPHQSELPVRNGASPAGVVAFATHGRTLATSSLLGTTTVWDLTDPAQPHPLGPPLTGHTNPVNVVAFAPDGRTLATGGDDGAVILWDLTDPVQPQRLGPTLAGHGDWVMSVAFAPGGRTLATGGADKTVILWDVTDRTQPHRLGPPLTGHSGRVWSVAFAPDGHTLATASEDKTVTLWDLTDPAQPHPLGPPLTGHSGSVVSVAFAPDGRTLATGSADKTTILWDVTDRTQPRQLGTPLTGHTDTVFSMSFTPDGHTLATGSTDATVILWDVTDRTQPRQLAPPLTGHTGLVRSVAFAPNGHTLATGSLDGTAILWDVTDPAQPHRLGPPLTSKTLAVFSVAFAPDSHTLLMGSLDAILWDVTDPAQPHRLPPLTSNLSVTSAAFAPDGPILATGSRDGTATLWDLTSLNQIRDHPVERACSTTHGGFNRDEWVRYVPDLPYQESCPA